MPKVTNGANFSAETAGSPLPSATGPDTPRDADDGVMDYATAGMLSHQDSSEAQVDMCERRSSMRDEACAPEPEYLMADDELTPEKPATPEPVGDDPLPVTTVPTVQETLSSLLEETNEVISAAIEGMAGEQADVGAALPLVEPEEVVSAVVAEEPPAPSYEPDLSTIEEQPELGYQSDSSEVDSLLQPSKTSGATSKKDLETVPESGEEEEEEDKVTSKADAE